MNVLTLDLGTKTGWAMSVEGIICSGTEEFKNSRYSGGGMRFLNFNKWLNDVHRASPIGSVYFEEVRRHMGVDAAHCYGGFLGHLSAWCEVNKIPYQGIPVGTIKKYATGKGNAKKPEMIAAAQARWPNQRILDDNQADALWILATALKL